VVAIIARLVSGWAADRRAGGHLLRVGGLLFLGGVSALALAFARDAWVFIPAAFAVSATAWSSNALFMFAMVKNQPHAPARAASVVQFGAFAGSTLAPFAFGFVAEHASTRAAWLLVAATLLVDAAIVLYARHTLRPRPRH
jgi:MFS family permease